MNDSRREKAIEVLSDTLWATANRKQQDAGVVRVYLDGAEWDVSLDGYTTEQLEGLGSFFGELSHIEDLI